MPHSTIREAVAQGRRLISDGAWGTLLQARGLGPGECPELWCLEREQDVLAAARSYVEAGADMIQSDSFGGSRFKLAHYGLAERAAEINEAAARISRQAAGDGVWVIASVGPSGVMLIEGRVSEEELYEGFVEQVTALARGGADAICVETMSAMDEAALAIRAAREHTDCEVIATFTLEKTKQGDFRSMMGLDPESAVRGALEAGAHIVGANCGNGIRGMIDIAGRMRVVAGDTPILVHANAGLPKTVEGRTVFPESPEEMAAQAPALWEAGVNILGGCCGTTPEHIRALRSTVEG